ncbi:MAG: putative bifunctional diguanylate cyclase/phosphodiesterase, partial [Candidatus Binatia bacterium]
ATRDAWVIAALAAPCFAVAAYFDLFERFRHLAHVQEAWQLDELVVTGFLLGMAALLFSIRRVFDLRAAYAQATELARHDALTGLPNRRLFLEELGGWKSLLRNDERCALFLIDLDQFKPVNDLYGHRLGDEVLRVTAARLKQIVGDRALVARIGGDEFGILLPVASDNEAPLRVARSIVKEVPEPIQLASLSVKVGVGVGIAICTADDEQLNELAAQDGDASETLMRQADMALYQAKREGRSGYYFFHREMDEQLRRRIELEREIAPAIEAGQIVPYYQPLIDLRSGTVVGCEALARWEHPRRGLLPPSILIPIAENTGLISELTYSLLRQAICDAKTWPGELSVSINLSPRQFADVWLAEKVFLALTENTFPVQRLEFEITETTFIDRIDEARTTLRSLRNLGVHIALDDFGAGYAGLSYLRQFGFDRIKIDRSFVTDMLTNPHDQKIVEAIVNFSRALGLQTTAEGIESLEVRNRLIELGCGTGQGFYFCKPKPNAEILRYLDNTHGGLRQVG